MMSLRGNKIRCVTLFFETDLDCSSSIESDEEKYKIQHAEREVTYGIIKISFIIGLSAHTGSIFILKESSKRCLIFFYFSVVFEKSANILRQVLSFDRILRQCLIFKVLKIITKKQILF